MMTRQYSKFRKSTRLDNLEFNYDKTETKALKELSATNARIDGELLNRIKLWKIGRRISVDNDVIQNLEQLRILENGYKIGVAITGQGAIGVDTPEDLEKVREIMKKVQR